MRVIRFKDHAALSRYAADLFIDQLSTKPASRLGLATGSTPIELYRLLVEANQTGQVGFKDVVTYNLDEYLGLPAGHPESYAQFMKDKLFDQVDIQPGNTHVPNGQASDADKAARDYEDLLQSSGGIDLQVLGLGANGHIGFNEPADELPGLTHKVELDDQTRRDNARFFDSIDQVPTQAITMGVASIMRSKRIVLLASGANKAQAIKQMVEGNITTQLPASLLQLHPAVLVLVDEAAARELNETSYEIF